MSVFGGEIEGVESQYKEQERRPRDLQSVIFSGAGRTNLVGDIVRDDQDVRLLEGAKDHLRRLI